MFVCVYVASTQLDRSRWRSAQGQRRGNARARDRPPFVQALLRKVSASTNTREFSTPAHVATNTESDARFSSFGTSLNVCTRATIITIVGKHHRYFKISTVNEGGLRREERVGEANKNAPVATCFACECASTYCDQRAFVEQFLSLSSI